MHHCTRPLHLKAWRAGSAIFQVAQEVGSRGVESLGRGISQSRKCYLASPPVLVAPTEKEPLLLYIAATNQVISVVLVAERDAPPKKSSKTKGKRPGNSLPGQRSKKRLSGDQGSHDPDVTATLPDVTKLIVTEYRESLSEGTPPGATSFLPQDVNDMEETDPL